MQQDDFHNLTPGVEFTNSYQDHVNSTSDYHAHFSGFYCIISLKSRKCPYFQRKNLHPVDFTRTRWKLLLQSGINFYN